MNNFEKITIIDVCREENGFSRIFVNKCFECYGLEPINGMVVKPGFYKIVLRTFGEHHEKYSIKFSDFHCGMLEIIVPGRSAILIHVGNYHEDTKGCLLVGKSYEKNAAEPYLLWSKIAYENIYRKVIKAAKDNSLFINFLSI